MNYTANELALCRRLHALGVRPEIRVGDWYIERHDKTPILVNYDCVLKHPDYIYLWSWERAREWMREKGWRLSGHADHGKEITCSFYNWKTLRDELGQGQTDLEAILAAMVQVAEEECPMKP